MIRQLKYGLTQLFLLAHKKYLKASLPLASVSNLSYPLSGLKLVVFLQNGLIKRRTRLDERNRVGASILSLLTVTYQVTEFERVKKIILGTIHLRRRQIFAISDPYPSPVDNRQNSSKMPLPPLQIKTSTFGQFGPQKLQTSFSLKILYGAN